MEQNVQSKAGGEEGRHGVKEKGEEARQEPV